jgi:hypothetical protein
MTTEPDLRIILLGSRSYTSFRRELSSHQGWSHPTIPFNSLKINCIINLAFATQIPAYFNGEEPHQRLKTIVPSEAGPSKIMFLNMLLTEKKALN